MREYYRTRGYVISKKDIREADQAFKIYTKDFGKIEVTGKAIRKTTSKLRSGINLFYLSDIEFIQGKNFKTLTDATLIEKPEKDIVSLSIKNRICEILDSLICGEEKDERIFKLIGESFDNLNCYYFFWNLVSFLGYGNLEKNQIIEMFLQGKNVSRMDKKSFEELKNITNSYFMQILHNFKRSEIIKAYEPSY